MKYFDRNVQELIQPVIQSFSFVENLALFSDVLVVILGPLKGGLNKRVTEIVM